MRAANRTGTAGICAALALLAWVLAGVLAGIGPAAAQSSIVEQAPTIDILRIGISGGGLSHSVAPYAGTAEPLVIPLPEGGSGAVSVEAEVRADNVDDFRMLLVHGGSETDMTARDLGGGIALYSATVFPPADTATNFALIPLYRPVAEPIHGSPFVDDDGQIDAILSYNLSNALDGENACEAAASRYFGGHRAAGMVVDFLQEAGAVGVGLVIDGAATVLTGGTASVSSVRALAKQFIISVGVNMVKSFTGNFIRGFPVTQNWRSNLFSAFTNGVLDVSFHRALSNVSLRMHQWLDHTSASQEMNNFARWLATQEINAGNWAGNALAQEKLAELLDRVLLEYRAQLDRMGLSPAYFLQLSDDVVIDGHRLQVAGLQWTVTGKASVVVTCTPPGADAPTDNILIQFTEASDGTPRNIRISREPAVSGQEHDVDDLLDAENVLDEMMTAAGAAPADELGPYTTPDGWRQARASGPHAVLVAHAIPADQVPAGAAWRVELASLQPADTYDEDNPHRDFTVLAGTEMAGEVEVVALVGGAWLPVSGATVEVEWDGPAGGAPETVTDSHGIAWIAFATPAEPAITPFLLTVAHGERAERPGEIETYDYVVEVRRIVPASAEAMAASAEQIELHAQLLRRVANRDGEIGQAAPIGWDEDLHGIRAITDGLATLSDTAGTLGGDIAVVVAPDEDGRFTVFAASEYPGDVAIRFVGAGGRYAMWGDALGQAPVRFTDHPTDIELAFGPGMAGYLQPDGSYRIEDVDIHADTPIPIEVMVVSSAPDDDGAPRADVALRLSVEGNGEVGLIGARPISGDDGIARWGDGELPAAWHPAEGSQTIVISTPGAPEPLILTVVGVDNSDTFGLLLAPLPEVAEVGSGGIVVTGSLRLPEGADFDWPSGDHTLVVETDASATLTVDAPYLASGPSLGSGGVTQSAIVRPDLETGLFTFTVDRPDVGPLRVVAYILDRDGTVAEFEVTLQFVDWDRPGLAGREPLPAYDVEEYELCDVVGFDDNGAVFVCPDGDADGEGEN